MTWIKVGILYRKPQLLNTAANYNTMLNLGCDYGMFFEHIKLELSKKEEEGVDQNDYRQLRFSLLGGFIGCIENLVIVGWSIRIQLT